MKKTKLNLLFLSLSFLAVTSVQAQVIVLSCKKELTRAFLENHPKFYEEMCSKYGENQCMKAQESRDEVTKCKQSGLSYSHNRVYTFEKKSLDSKGETLVDLVNQNCWGANSNKRNVLTSTATTLYFAEGESTFNVDRATLQGGWSEDRSWHCDITQKNSKNKI